MRHYLFAYMLLISHLPVVAQQKFITIPAGYYTIIPAGYYTIGEKNNSQNPLRKIHLATYELSNVEVTNSEFAAFVEATGYLTDAERSKNALVFAPGLKEFKWLKDSTASWRFPNGKTRDSITYKMNHPVTTISYMDILAYCQWAKVRLPSFEEWEVACRAGSGGKYFSGKHYKTVYPYANVWHLKNHLTEDNSDGFSRTAPIASFKPNAWGFYDMYGNVFEFCYGPLPADNGKNVAHARGGSWWCSAYACAFFNSVNIGTVHPHASFSNQGFRVAKISSP